MSKSNSNPTDLIKDLALFIEAGEALLKHAKYVQTALERNVAETDAEQKRRKPVAKPKTKVRSAPKVKPIPAEKVAQQVDQENFKALKAVLSDLKKANLLDISSGLKVKTAKSWTRTQIIEAILDRPFEKIEASVVKLTATQEKEASTKAEPAEKPVETKAEEPEVVEPATAPVEKGPILDHKICEGVALDSWSKDNLLKLALELKIDANGRTKRADLRDDVLRQTDEAIVAGYLSLWPDGEVKEPEKLPEFVWSEEDFKDLELNDLRKLSTSMGLSGSTTRRESVLRSLLKAEPSSLEKAWEFHWPSDSVLSSYNDDLTENDFEKLERGEICDLYRLTGLGEAGRLPSKTAIKRILGIENRDVLAQVAAQIRPTPATKAKAAAPLKSGAMKAKVGNLTRNNLRQVCQKLGIVITKMSTADMMDAVLDRTEKDIDGALAQVLGK